MGLFSKNIGPVFLKETSDADMFLLRMQKLQEDAGGKLKKEIEKQINLAKYGAMGEQNVAFELKNSGMDMYILHDIYLEANGLSAQIDYIVITRKHIYVIECKNLIGNIEIDNMGSFIRTYELFGKKIKEGIYSPITQNERHLQVLKEIGRENRRNFLSKMLFEKNFEESYKSLVVLANPKTYLNAKFAKKEVKERVIRADQLIGYIRNMDDNKKEKSMSTDEMLELGQFFLNAYQPDRSDYVRKYEEIIEQMQKEENAKLKEEFPQKTLFVDEEKKEKQVENSKVEDRSTVFTEKRNTNAESNIIESMQESVGKESKNREEVIKRLKAFRLEQSRKEKIKPYYIFNDAQMEDLIEKNPKTKEELLRVSGFGKVKTEKYGDEILKCLI